MILLSNFKNMMLPSIISALNVVTTLQTRIIYKWYTHTHTHTQFINARRLSRKGNYH